MFLLLQNPFSIIEFLTALTSLFLFLSPSFAEAADFHYYWV